MPSRNLAVAFLGLALAGTASATPPKPTLEGGARGTATQDRGGAGKGLDDVRGRNAMALRGGVGEDMWLEALHRLTRVPSPRREQVTRLVRGYIVAADAWRTTQAPEMKKLTEVIVAARKSGAKPPIEVTTKVREIRAAMPRLSTLQEQVWDVLSGPEQSRLVDEIADLKKSGLPKDIVDGRRPAGSPAVVTRKPDGDAADADPKAAEPGTDPEADPKTDPPEAGTPAPALWSFVDDPNAGKPLPSPTDESEGTSAAPPKG